ncbi:hypothetical protein JCM16303_003346 [Sporobolomyces ruberrimus]
MTSTSRTMPYLPPEIIDEILRDERLDDCDLASCCLVSRTWINSARKSLYDSLIFHVQEHTQLHPGSDPSSAPLSPHHLDRRSSQLFTTLLSNRALGSFVRFIELSEACRESCLIDREVVWMRPEEVISNLACLCPDTKALDLEYSPSSLDSCIKVIQTDWTKVSEIRVGSVTRRTWEQLCYVDSLRGVTLYDFVIASSSSPGDPVIPVHITELYVYECDLSAFETLRVSTSSVLHDLGVPLTVVSELRLSDFPQIISLTLYEAYEEDTLEEEESIPFLEDLATSKSLKRLALSARVLRSILPPTGKLGHFLPSSCRRVDLFRCQSSGTIASVIQQSRVGSRIRQLGLPCDEKEKKDNVHKEFLVATRALLDLAGVELIWRG